MKYLKKFEILRSRDIFDNSKYKRYLITKYKSDKHDDIYINIYENLYPTMGKNSFRALYYYDEFAKKIEEFINRQEMDYIPIDKIVYESDDLEDSIKTFNEIIEMEIAKEKYNL